MQIADAQRDVRETYAGGFYGQLVSGLVWLLAAALGTWVSPEWAIVALLTGGFLIFPLTTAALRLARRPTRLPPGHPMTPLAMQVAFTVPVGLLVALGATAYRQDWFFPASMVVVGGHYLPFVFLYGMRAYAVLAAVLVWGGVALALWVPGSFSIGGWLTGSVLVLAAVVLRRATARPASQPGARPPGGSGTPARS